MRKLLTAVASLTVIVGLASCTQAQRDEAARLQQSAQDNASAATADSVDVPTVPLPTTSAGPLTVVANCQSVTITGSGLDDTEWIVPSIDAQPSQGQGHPVNGEYHLVIAIDPTVYKVGGYQWIVNSITGGMNSGTGINQTAYVNC